MAGRILNRRELRKQSDEAEQLPEGTSEATPAVAAPQKIGPEGSRNAPGEKTAGEEGAASPRVRWGIFDAGMKQVAIFDYNQRTAADEKLADLLEKKKGIHFMQMVKEPMPEPEPVAP